MIDHVAIPVSNLEASRRFYEPLMDKLGAKVMIEMPGLVIFGTNDGMVALRESEQVAPLHVAFKADRPGVDSFHEAGLAAGATDNGAPGVRPHYHNIEAVCHQPS
jgi:catechol 2,3-dioxygenase-like lactoylglutathione lyase family enzyme